MAIGIMVTAQHTKAQVNVNINISSQPLWGPVGYDYVEYYYLPDLEMYYYVPAHKFVYFYGGRWVFASSLPWYYRNYDLYTIHKVVINEPRPYRHFHAHRAKYVGYKGGPHHQVFIRNSKNPKYYVVKGHPHHGKRGTVNGQQKNRINQAQPKNSKTNKQQQNRINQAQPKNNKANQQNQNRIRQAQPKQKASPQNRERIRQVNQPQRARQGGGHKGGKH